ncbi:hypothetical protein ACFV5K_38090, partial [Streptomyces sp. NPDC059744]
AFGMTSVSLPSISRPISTLAVRSARFERDWTGTGRPLPPERWREGCLATATTHDLPSTAARLTGDHVTLRHRLGLLTHTLEQEQAEDATDTATWLGLLARLGLLPEGEGDEEGAVRAVHRDQPPPPPPQGGARGAGGGRAGRGGGRFESRGEGG